MNKTVKVVLSGGGSSYVRDGVQSHGVGWGRVHNGSEACSYTTLLLTQQLLGGERSGDQSWWRGAPIWVQWKRRRFSSQYCLQICTDHYPTDINWTGSSEPHFYFSGCNGYQKMGLYQDRLLVGLAL